MKSDWEPARPGVPWPELGELLLEGVPGVVSATVRGARHAVSEVRVWYEPKWPVGQVVDAVHQCLTKEAKARLATAKLHAIVARPDRRTEHRPRPRRVPAASAGWGSPDAPLKLVGHKVEEVEQGVVGVEVWIEWQGRTFSGAAVGPDVPPRSLRTPALATLRALHSCLQVLYEGPVQPGLVLESAVQVTVGKSPVAVVALTASENARPHPLTAAWAEQGVPELAVILATIHATSRTVSRWLSREPWSEARHPAAGAAPGRSARTRTARGLRFTLVDYDVDHDPSGDVGVGVRLAGFGHAVDRSRSGSDDGTAHLELGVSATLDAVHDLLRIGGWNERHDGALRPAGARRLRTGEHDIVVILAEALMNGHRVRLAGATSADGGVERASITAALQATNGLVAERAVRIMGGTDGDTLLGSPMWAHA